MRARTKLLNDIAERLAALLRKNNLRVGIDGVDGAGKTVFAGELAEHLRTRGLTVIRGSTDAFHNPRRIRYRLGRGSPEGYYRDSYNYPKLKELLLDPLGPSGSGRYRTEYFDHRQDRVVETDFQQVLGPAFLLFEGIFVHRPELLPYWDYSIFVDVSRPESLRRCCAREGSGSPDPEAPENRRYVIGQRIYFDRCDPKSKATIVVNNEDIESPYIVVD